jgi:formyl-CoA transferase
LEKSEFFADARRDLTGPIHGIRVLEITTSWAGPMAGCMLADLGAEVIKVEHPDGEIGRVLGPHLPGGAHLSLLYETANRNKRNLSVDMRKEVGRDLLIDLGRTCDLVVENFKPGTLHGWGLGYEHFCAAKPDIVYVSISGFGQFGPHQARAAYDPLVQAQSGWMSLNGEIGGGPVKAPTFLGDDLAGMQAALAALAALRHRDATGEGQHVDVALMDAILGASNMFPSMARLGIEAPRTANQFPQVAPFNVYACRGGSVFLGMSLNSHWEIFANAVGRPELVEDPRYATTELRTQNRESVDELVSRWCSEQDQMRVVELLGGAGLPVAPVNDYRAATDDPNIEARDMLTDIELSDGSRAPLLGPVPKFSRTPIGVRSGAPTIGQDNASILDELGIDDARRRALREAGVI